MARAAEEALVKIESVLPDKERHRASEIQIHAMATEMTDDIRKVIDTVEKAVEKRQRLSLLYQDVSDQYTRRVIRPLGLWFWGKVWTLVAWCELRDDFRMFRLDRIDESNVTGDPFQVERGKTLKDFYRAMEQQSDQTGMDKPE